MDMGLLGETIVAPSAGQKNYGFWMPAGGNDGVAGVEVFYNSSGSAFQVHLETKSSDQDDSAAVSLGSVTVTTAGSTVTPYSFAVANARDLVRYRVDMVKLSTSIVHLQFAEPLWHPN